MPRFRCRLRRTDLILAIATDDLLYITGGEFYEPDDTGTLQMYYQANTLIVDLTQSWTNQTVSATSVTDADGMIVRLPILGGPLKNQDDSLPKARKHTDGTLVCPATNVILRQAAKQNQPVWRMALRRVGLSFHTMVLHRGDQQRQLAE